MEVPVERGPNNRGMANEAPLNVGDLGPLRSTSIPGDVSKASPGGIADEELEVAVRLAVARLQHAPALVSLPCPGVRIHIGDAVF